MTIQQRAEADNPLTRFTPREIVATLDQYVIGQQAAKRALANALRNRWRRQKVREGLRQEITPRNVLMIGPTGSGKTELARRIATLAQAPFIKVEATKFTEVGYVGRDVESMVRDLLEASLKMTREQALARVSEQALAAAEERILDILLPPSPGKRTADSSDSVSDSAAGDSPARQLFRQKLRKGELDQQEIEVAVSAATGMGIDIMAPPGMEDMTEQLKGLFKNLGADKKHTRKMTVQAALKLLKEEEAGKWVQEEEIKVQAVHNAEQNGIIFIDEIDKISARTGASGSDASREGVQRDLLPLIEGSTVNTKYGPIQTDHILFIASGAFHLSRPSDLIPELQGRLPIRVELTSLGADEFERILTEPRASLTVQYQAMLATEGVDLRFSTDAVRAIAEMAHRVNEKTENIGARRLHTILERLLEELSYSADSLSGQRVEITADYVKQHLDEIASDDDLSQYIL